LKDFPNFLLWIRRLNRLLLNAPRSDQIGEIMEAFICSYQEFKARAKELLDNLNECDYTQAEGLQQALSLSYLHMDGSNQEIYSAKIILDLVGKEIDKKFFPGAKHVSE
jgi:hypothetical protein